MAIKEEVQKINKQLEVIHKTLDKMQRYADEVQMKNLNIEANNFIIKMQKMAIDARLILLQVGVGDDIQQLTEDLKEAFNIQISITPEGWVKLKLPSILPQSAKSAWFIRKPLEMALSEYFDRYFQTNNRFFRITEAVIAFVFYYSEEIPDDRCCDIDNIGNTEIKGIIDDLSAFILQDDGPFQLYHFYMGARAPESFTEVYVIPQTDFRQWLKSDLPALKNMSEPDKTV